MRRRRGPGVGALAVLLALLSALLLPAAVLAAGAEEFGIASASASLSTHQAGDHPDFTTTIEMNTDPASEADQNGLKLPFGTLQDVRVALPPGLLANLNAVTTCPADSYASGNGECPFSSQVGVVVVQAYGQASSFTASIFKLPRVGEDEVARFGFRVLNVPVIIKARVRSDSDYGATAEITGISSFARVAAVTTTLWGVPAAASHDTERLTTQETTNGTSTSPPRPAGIEPAPFMTNPTSCEAPLQLRIEADSYQRPGAYVGASADLGTVDGCEQLGFEPGFSLEPTNREAGSVSGANSALTIPQNLAVNGLASSQLRDTRIVLPRGVTIAAGAAAGLEACSEAQVGYRVSPPPAANCPPASKIASVEIASPALERPIDGAVYQRTPEPGHLTRAWLVADELGVHVKVPGEFQLDPLTGQVTAVFAETPQVPVSSFSLRFKSGAQGVLATPLACGTYQAQFFFAPWSGGAAVEGSVPLTFDSHCDSGGFGPTLVAGAVNPSAGSYSPFVTDLVARSGEQNLAGLRLTLPPGVLAKLAGVPLCPDAAAVSGACPAGSRIGDVTAATGPGPSPLWIPQPGKAPTAVYLAGPYRGGPYSLVVVTPAQAGPFDLGLVVVRVALQVDPRTTLVTAESDPLPQILEGIPITYRDVHIQLDRPEFTLNPTNCEPLQSTGTATSAAGATAALTSRFQVGDCARLGFEPKLALRLSGPTHRGGHPKLKAVLTFPKTAGANIARAQVSLPHSEFLDQGSIRTVCTQAQLRSATCPRASIYGRAKAWTPLLDRPLEGPVYLGVGFGHQLPDLVAELGGQIRVLLNGKVDTDKQHGLRNTFSAVPDAPVSRFVLELNGGPKKGLIENSENLCRQPQRATVEFNAQNGVRQRTANLIANDCGSGRRKR